MRENPAARVAEIVASAGGDVLLLAGPRLTGELLAHGLVDEMLFIVGPVLLGAGRPVIPDIGREIELRLLDAGTYPQGTLITRYAIDR
ncbi:dihydrofolate reductase family protein [Micromonospora sp. CPCC 206061]|uniref:dihydrofolate reductase family protein n=1 Tax=Micromonospora sp. CPCC 206061 TaxID=3122410 RepID=UPI002FF0AD05